MNQGSAPTEVDPSDPDFLSDFFTLSQIAAACSETRPAPLVVFSGHNRAQKY